MNLLAAVFDWTDPAAIGYPALGAGVLLGSIVPVVPTGAVVGAAAAHQPSPHVRCLRSRPTIADTAATASTSTVASSVATSGSSKIPPLTTPSTA